MGFSDTAAEEEKKANPLHSPEFQQMLDHYLYQGSILVDMIEAVEGEFTEFHLNGDKIRIIIERNDDEE